MPRNHDRSIPDMSAVGPGGSGIPPHTASSPAEEPHVSPDIGAAAEHGAEAPVDPDGIVTDPASASGGGAAAVWAGLHADATAAHHAAGAGADDAATEAHREALLAWVAGNEAVFSGNVDAAAAADLIRAADPITVTQQEAILLVFTRVAQGYPRYPDAQLVDPGAALDALLDNPALDENHVAAFNEVLWNQGTAQPSGSIDPTEAVVRVARAPKLSSPQVGAVQAIATTYWTDPVPTPGLETLFDRVLLQDDLTRPQTRALYHVIRCVREGREPAPGLEATLTRVLDTPELSDAQADALRAVFGSEADSLDRQAFLGTILERGALTPAQANAVASIAHAADRIAGEVNPGEVIGEVLDAPQLTDAHPDALRLVAYAGDSGRLGDVAGALRSVLATPAITEDQTRDLEALLPPKAVSTGLDYDEVIGLIFANPTIGHPQVAALAGLANGHAREGSAQQLDLTGFAEAVFAAPELTYAQAGAIESVVYTAMGGAELDHRAAITTVLATRELTDIQLSGARTVLASFGSEAQVGRAALLDAVLARPELTRAQVDVLSRILASAGPADGFDEQALLNGLLGL
jgi:hypothetical protein